MLPAHAGVRQYRVKRIGDGQERTVSEPQLLGIEPLKMVRPEIGAQQEQQRIRNARASERAQALARRDERRHRHAATPAATSALDHTVYLFIGQGASFTPTTTGHRRIS